jgi:hypothetical protein
LLRGCGAAALRQRGIFFAALRRLNFGEAVNYFVVQSE